jgi:hypothetical protein
MGQFRKRNQKKKRGNWWAGWDTWGEINRGLQKNPFEFSPGFMGSKFKDSKYFWAEFELGKAKINLNKLFEYISNLELLKS